MLQEPRNTYFKLERTCDPIISRFLTFSRLYFLFVTYHPSFTSTMATKVSRISTVIYLNILHGVMGSMRNELRLHIDLYLPQIMLVRANLQLLPWY